MASVCGLLVWLGHTRITAVHRVVSCLYMPWPLPKKEAELLLDMAAKSADGLPCFRLEPRRVGSAEPGQDDLCWANQDT